MATATKKINNDPTFSGIDASVEITNIPLHALSTVKGLRDRYKINTYKPSEYTGSKMAMYLGGHIKAVSKKIGMGYKYKDAILFEDEDMMVIDEEIIVPLFLNTNDISIVRFIGGKTLENYLIIQCTSVDQKFGIISLIPTQSKLPRYVGIYKIYSERSTIKVIYTSTSTPLSPIPNVFGMSNIKVRSSSDVLDDDDKLLISMQKAGLKNNLESFSTVNEIARSTVGLIYSTVNPELSFDILNTNKQICKKK